MILTRPWWSPQDALTVIADLATTGFFLCAGEAACRTVMYNG